MTDATDAPEEADRTVAAPPTSRFDDEAMPAAARDEVSEEAVREAAREAAARREAARKEARDQERVRSAIEWVAVIVGALVVALVVKTFLFQAFYIPSASMEPTLGEGDRVLVNKLSYDLHDVNRGDVVVFELPADKVGVDGIKDLIKRVIGLPGDTIETRDGAVYVNDRLLDEPYLAEGTITGDPADGSNPEIARQVVPEDTVFVMGDNRDNSHDSRYSDRGPVPIDSIVGRAFVLVWPPGKMGWL